MALDYVTRYIIFPDHDSITILFSKSGIVAIKKKIGRVHESLIKNIWVNPNRNSENNKCEKLKLIIKIDNL